METTSHEGAESVPSTPGQFGLARILVDELKELGLTDAKVDSHCYVRATLSANTSGMGSQKSSKKIPTIGLIAHLDTSEAVSGKKVKPQVIRKYEGGPVTLKSGEQIPYDAELRKCVGHTLVVTDGRTLLGADDKAGIAAVMTALERMIVENRPHGTIRVCFTPDEEIGRGTDFFDLKKFGAKYAYTVDGDSLGEINRETFTADRAVMTVTGKDCHPGSAKGVMVNATRILAKIIAKLPRSVSPETTDKRQPFIHPMSMEGNVSQATAVFILRAFDEPARKRNQEILRNAMDSVLAAYPGSVGDLRVSVQYLNMGQFLSQHPAVLDKLEEAVRRSGVTPRWIPIRGGTDGSQLTEMGLPTPNIFTGGRNFHSTTEWLSVNDLEKSVETLIHLAELWACE